MSVGDLRSEHLKVLGEATRSSHKQYLVRRIVWHIQAKQEGGLSERARRRAKELADEAFLRTRAPVRSGQDDKPDNVMPFSPAHGRRLPMPGAVLTRPYRGRTIEVIVLDEGFEYDGQRFRSLTAVAKAVTGSHWNGYGFFGLTRKAARR